MTKSQYFTDKVVLITGGSKGLGLAMAQEYGSQGAKVLIVARHEDELRAAEQKLRVAGITIDAAPCDVSKQDEVERTIDDFESRHGQIDVLVNNAGTIQVGPADTMLVEDFRTALDIMLWGTIYPTLHLLPGMRARDRGHIVNITSIGGKVSVPHLLAYSTAKFAAVGFSEGLQAELGDSGVKVTTVVPGLMRTGSYLNANFQGETHGEFRWFSLSSSAPFLTISGESAARRIVRATENGEAEVILTIPANILARVKGAVPGTTQHLLTLSKRFLPDSTGQLGSRTGSDLRRVMNSGFYEKAITLGNRAVERLQPAQAQSNGHEASTRPTNGIAPVGSEHV